MEQLQKLAELLRSINEKKAQMKRLQTEVEIKIQELDKLLDNVAKLKIEKPVAESMASNGSHDRTLSTTTKSISQTKNSKS